jgi:hypothetical protein
LEGWGCERSPALYLIGLFEVERAGFATSFDTNETRRLFSANFHVRHRELYEQQKTALVLIKGGPGSRLFEHAHPLGGSVARPAGLPWQMISTEMATIFGRFGGIGSLQRSNPRWVEEGKVSEAAAFLRQLR